MLDFKSVKINKPDDVNLIFGQSHFIKTVEDLYEVLIGAVPGIRFGLGFVESSGACKIRCEGNDPALKELAQDNLMELGCGHSFIIFIRQAYPINVLNAIKAVPEVCCIYCASANPVEVIVAETKTGRGVLGVIDGAKPKGIEDAEDIKWRAEFLRKTGYKL